MPSASEAQGGEGPLLVRARRGLPHPDRLAALAASGLETDPETSGLERAVGLVQTLLGVPAAFVSVVGADRQRVVAQRGFSEALWVPQEGPLTHSYCRHAVESRAPLVIEDAGRSPLACAGVLAEAFGIQAYLGVPFRGPSEAVLGALCALDGAPRAWSPREIEVVTALAATVEAELTLRAEIAQRGQAEDRYRTLFDGSPDAILVLDPETERVLDANAAATTLYGLDREHLVGQSVKAFSQDAQRGESVAAHLVAGGGHQQFETVQYRADGTPVDLRISASLVRLDGRPVVLSVNRDVTALRRAERAVAQERAWTDRLAMVAAKTTNGVVVTDAEGRTEWVNEGFTRITGYTLDEMRGRKPGAVLQGPDTDPATVERLHAQVRSREPFSAEILNVHKNGTPYWIRMEVSPLVEDGVLTGFMAIETDVTERRQAEATLRASEARFRLVTETAGVGMFVSDAEGGRTSFTMPARSVLGYADAEPMTFARFSALTHPDDRQAVVEAIAEAQDPAGPGRMDLDHRVVRPDTGEVRWVTVCAETVFDAERRPVQIAGVVLDATQRKRAEIAARENEARFRRLAETAHDVILTVDEHSEIQYANGAAEAVFGYAPDDLVGRKLSMLMPPRFRDAHAAGLARYLRSGEKRLDWGAVEVPGQRRDGTEVPLSISFGEYVQEGQRTFTAIVRDVTTQKEAERARFEGEREARRRSEEMLRLKDAFLSNMSHELRTPLTAILGFAEVLADEVADEHREFARAIVHGGRRLGDTLNSVLDLAQIEAGAVTLDLGPVDAAAEAAHAVALLRPVADAAGLALSLDAAPATALADRAALRRVLHNLVDNAVKFTPAGTVVVTVAADGPAVRLVVADTGIGIAPGFLPRLFDEFTQASEGHARTHEGNGLGLSITKRLVELMGGEIAVESAPGEGTRVTVGLPAAPPEGA